MGQAKDPIDRCIRDFTARRGGPPPAELADIDARVERARLDEAVGACENEPMPEATATGRSTVCWTGRRPAVRARMVPDGLDG